MTTRGVVFLGSPDLSGVEQGSPKWFDAQREMILSRTVVRMTYERWYGTMLGDVASLRGNTEAPILEIGSGARHVKTIDPRVITSDIVEGHSDRIVDV